MSDRKPKFQLFLDKVEEHRVRLVAANGEIICTTEGYSSKGNAEHAIGLMKGSADYVVEDLTL